jgi:AcrR family transcriptional regulator
MASDARVRYTKMVIVQSFARLLKEKPINKITVKEICNLAEINRTTFYKHYLDVYDLLDKIEAQFLEELLSVLQSRENTTVKDMLTFIMVNFKAEEETYKAICSPYGDPAFSVKIFEACHDISLSGNALESRKLSPAQKEWAYRFAANGCNGIINQWISGGMKEPISEVADFAEQLVDNALINI